MHTRGIEQFLSLNFDFNMLLFLLGDRLSYFNWLPTYPSTVGNECVLVDSARNGWLDEDCSQTKPFYCQTGKNLLCPKRVIDFYKDILPQKQFDILFEFKRKQNWMKLYLLKRHH